MARNRNQIVRVGCGTIHGHTPFLVLRPTLIGRQHRRADDIAPPEDIRRRKTALHIVGRSAVITMHGKIGRAIRLCGQHYGTGYIQIRRRRVDAPLRNLGEHPIGPGDAEF